MKLKILAFVAFAAMWVISPANAGYYNAGSILSDCESESIGLQNDCVMYLAGINDALATLDKWDILTEKVFCVPANVSTEQLRKVFIKAANETPQYLHLSGSSVVMTTFAEAFPCE
jgi:hypothetical protein